MDELLERRKVEQNVYDQSVLVIEYWVPTNGHGKQVAVWNLRSKNNHLIALKHVNVYGNTYERTS